MMMALPMIKKKGKQGKLPNKLQKVLKEKTGWDYNGKREDFFQKTSISCTDACYSVYKYADGTIAYNYSRFDYGDIPTLESYYYGYTGQNIKGTFIGMPFMELAWPMPLPLPTWGWSLAPLVPIF